MRAIELTLLSTTYMDDSIGQKIPILNKKIVPIIEHESIYHEEFYEANEQGLKPTLKVKISALSYHGEKELIYMNEHYSIMRLSSTNPDEISLICEVKAGHVNEKN